MQTRADVTGALVSLGNALPNGARVDFRRAGICVADNGNLITQSGDAPWRRIGQVAGDESQIAAANRALGALSQDAQEALVAMMESLPA